MLRLSELLKAIHAECERCLNEQIRLDTAFPLDNLFFAAFIMELVQRRWTVRYARWYLPCLFIAAVDRLKGTRHDNSIRSTGKPI